ncbi:MAG TPA: BatA and WFA domain-containing protein [Chthoniobacteraceae bacterium]|nr:BatA and WFA domain-containing protein [Chthoniobacteraceae bacterium]
MTWLQPWAAWFLAGLPLIVLLYMLKVRRRPATVSTLIFWQRVLEEHRRRALFQKLRHMFSLLLHLLIFALIVGALARPTFDYLVQNGASTVIILDIRARMQGVEDDGESRFAKAVRQAKQSIRDASAARQFAILTLGPQPSVAAPFTGNERTLNDALQRIEVTDATGDSAAALRLARELLASRPGQHRIIGVSDAALAGDIETYSVGTPRENVAITRFATRPLPASPQTSEILVEVQNFGANAAQTNLELRYDDRLLDVKPINLSAGETFAQVFPSVPRPTTSSRGWLTAKLNLQDALASDNLARAVLPPPRPVRALLVTQGNIFLEKALAADPGISFELISPDSWSAVIASKFDVVIHDDHLPADWSRYHSLFIKRTPFDHAGTQIEQPTITDIDAEHPALRLVDLGSTTILRAYSLDLPASQGLWTYEAPLRSFDHPLLIVGEERGGHRVAALGLDLTATDLPLRVAFPLLITNTIHWLAGVGENAGRAFVAGEVIALAQGEQIVAPPSSGYFQPLRNGYYEVQRDGRGEWIAVNTFTTDESDLRRAGDAAFKSLVPIASPAISSFAGWPVWRWLALGALALFTAEWSLFHRRRTE